MICSSFIKDKVQPNDYLKEYIDNIEMFHKSNNSEIAEYNLKFVPKELRAIRGFKMGTLSSKEIDELLNSTSTIEFILEIDIPSNQNQEFLRHEVDSMDYSTRVEYFSFGLKEDIEIFFDGNQVPISNYVFERNFGIISKGTILIDVPFNKSSELIEVKVLDRVYGSSPISFVFDNTEIQSLPQLKKSNKWKK